MNNKYEMTNIELEQKRNILFPFRLFRIGKIKTTDSESYSIRNYQCLEFCLRLKSAETETIDELDGKIYKYRFPHLFIKKPDVFHRYTIRSSRDAVFLIYPSEMAPRFEECGMTLSQPGIEFELTRELEEMIGSLIEMLPRSQEHGIAEKFDLLAFQILETIYMQRSSISGDNEEADRYIREIASYLQMHFTAKIDLDEICHKFGVSRRTFFRHWAKHYDRSPLQYLTELRINEAVRLLSMESMQIQEIARYLGFDNCAYFIQAFRRHHHGMTPGEFRRTQKSGNQNQ